MSYDTFCRQVFQNPPAPPVYVQPSLDAVNADMFRMSVNRIPNMNNNELLHLVKTHIDIITNDVLNWDRTYVYLFTDLRFVRIFNQAIMSIPVSERTKLACNILAYDYFTSDNPDFEIKKEYLSICKFVNRDVVNKLMTIPGIDENTATNLAFCRYSSLKEHTNVKRLNFTIYHKDPDMMTEQNIVWIYEKLFDRVTDLFIATMMENYSAYEQCEHGEEFTENYGTVGLCVLLLLNNMPTESIKKVLTEYCAYLSSRKYPPTRFSLHTLSGDYSRITNVVEFLSSNGYRIP